MPGALFHGEKLPGYRPGLAHVQPFVTTKTTRRNSATRQLGNSARSARMVRHICIQCIASIEIIVLEYVMETPTLAYDVVSYRPHLCPLLGKTGMEWEPFIKIKIQ